MLKYQETYRELEIDIANDPERQQRRDDADDAMLFVLGQNDN